MAVITGKTEKQANVPVSEQMLLVNYVIRFIKESGLFENLDIKLNFLSFDEDCICIRLFDDATKTSQYVDGSYEAQIRFSVIYRRLNVNGVVERVSAIDLINQLGCLFETTDVFEIDSNTIYVNSISQQTNAGLVYRDDSGIEDNGATFILKYDRN